MDVQHHEDLAVILGSLEQTMVLVVHLLHWNLRVMRKVCMFPLASGKPQVSFCLSVKTSRTSTADLAAASGSLYSSCSGFTFAKTLSRGSTK